MYYILAILVSSAIPPNQFTNYSVRFFPVGYTIKSDCDTAAAFLASQPATSALPTSVKQVYTCVGPL
jgi:hypothetical protein